MRFSVVVPIYRDGYLADALAAEIQRVMCAHLKLESLRGAVELIFVNDGSPDDSLQLLLEVRKKFEFVEVIDLSRNFGQHQAIACGLNAARGEVVLRMNVDQQDPPSEIPKLLEAMSREGADLVVGQYVSRQHPPLVRFTAWIYYSLFHLVTGFHSPQRTSPLRAMSRRWVDAYNSLTEKSRFPQGLDQWIGFKHLYLPTEHRARADGRSAYNFWSRSMLALNGLLSFSDRPLKLVATFGFCSAAAGLLVALVLILVRVSGYDFLPGWVSLSAIAMIAFGLQIASVGIVGIYVGRIFSEVQNRPLYIVREHYGVALPEGSAKEKANEEHA